MKIFNSSQVRELDAMTIKKEPIDSINLMERAAGAFCSWFIRLFDISKEVLVVAGPGNNGGDGLAIARILAERSFKVKVILLNLGSGFSADCNENLKRLRSVSKIDVKIICDETELEDIGSGKRIVDAVFGSGINRKVEGLPKKLIEKINDSGSQIISVDIPSGLFSEDNSGNDYNAIVRADYCLSFEFPFLSFFFPENAAFLGNWTTCSIGLSSEDIENTDSKYCLITDSYIKTIYKKRDVFSHKGSHGNALIIAGSYGMMGAAVLSTKACLRAGAGLVTSHIPRMGIDIIQSSVPEALTSADQSDIIFTAIEDLKKYSAICMGPGLRNKSNTLKGMNSVIQEARVPIVLDADAINMLAADQEKLGNLAENTIITPHPGEFDRLCGEFENSFSRHLKQIELSMKYKIVIVLKGHHTMITMPDGSCFINNTGNSGLATGGSGDVLSGLITGLLSQNYDFVEASVLGVYLHGLAADIALKNQSEESLLPTDVIDCFGKAFKSILL